MIRISARFGRRPAPRQRRGSGLPLLLTVLSALGIGAVLAPALAAERGAERGAGHGAGAAGGPAAATGATANPAAAAASTDSASASTTASATAAPAPSSTAPYRVVGLGDSVPAGTACGCASYVQLVGRQAARQAGRSARVDNLAIAGLTTSALLQQVRQAGASRLIASADLVIVTAGANDFDEPMVSDDSCAPPALACYRPRLSQQSALLAQVLARIRALRAGRGGTVLVTGYWNVFLDGQVGRAQGSPYVRNSNALTLADNRLIALQAQRQGATYVDIYTPFKGDGSRDDTGLLAADGDHPNAAGHRLIARTLEAALG